MKTSQILVCFGLMVATVLCAEEKTPLALESPVSAVNSPDSTCKNGDKVYNEGDVYRVFDFTSCVLNVCQDGHGVEIRGDCVDSYGRCHRHNTVWHQGCTAYICKVHTVANKHGGKTTKYEPVKYSKIC